jgi:hypothetical protein
LLVFLPKIKTNSSKKPALKYLKLTLCSNHKIMVQVNSCFRDVNQTKITDQSARRIFNEIRRCHLCPTNKPSCVFVKT